MRRSVLSLLALTPLLWSPLPGAEPDPVVDLLQVARDQDMTWQRRRADLILDLTHQDSERRIAALRGIGDLQDPALAGHLLAFLEPGTPDAEIIEAALSSARLKNAQAVLALRLHLTNPNEDVRMTAYLALDLLSGASEEDHLARAKDQDPTLRRAALQRLALFPTAAAAPLLIEGLARNPDPRLRRLCALGLGRLKDRTHGPALQVGLVDGDQSVRLATARALAALGYTPAIPVLLTLLEQPQSTPLAACLKQLAGDDFGYAAARNDQERRQAIDRAWSWWTRNLTRLNR